MNLYFVFTIDGDWNEYFYYKQSRAKRQPDLNTLVSLIRHEIALASSVINGKFLHFVHSSPLTRTFFLRPEFISLWRKIEKNGGSVGVHCHEEQLYRIFHFDDAEKMENAISFLTESLHKEGLSPISFRGGFMAFYKTTIPIMKKNGLLLDFSCDPDRYLIHEGEVISDWRGAPQNYYRMSYEDHRRPGNSKVIEIPLGKAGNHALYIDLTSLINTWLTCLRLSGRAKAISKPIVVSVLSHTYEFASFWKRLKIRLALTICKKYGKFISDKEALKIINEHGRENKA